MPLPTERQLLDLWEWGVDASPAARATALLAVAGPDAAPAALAGLPLGGRERRLLELRRSLLGHRMTALAACPHCGERHDVELDVGRLLAEFEERPLRTLTLHWTEFALTVRSVTGADLEAAATAPDAGARIRELLARCVVDARRGDDPCDAHTLPEAAWAAIGEALGAADPLADLTIELECAACGRQWATALDAAAYLWLELQTWAQRLLRDVHWLAAAYGWTEADVLQLSPWRRAAYLSLLGH